MFSDFYYFCTSNPSVHFPPLFEFFLLLSLILFIYSYANDHPLFHISSRLIVLHFVPPFATCHSEIPQLYTSFQIKQKKIDPQS